MQLFPGKRGTVEQVIHCIAIGGTSHTVVYRDAAMELCSAQPAQPYMLSLGVSDLNAGLLMPHSKKEMIFMHTVSGLMCELDTCGHGSKSLPKI